MQRGMIYRIVVIITATLLILLSSLSSRADEGMWLISLVKKNIDDMQRMGLKLSAEEIYSINQSSLKDAVVQLDDGGCSAELVSPNGLVLTNHHCAVGDIQYHSSATNNLLYDGFWATDYSSELPVPGKTALILDRVEDITERIIGQVSFNDSNYFRVTAHLAESIKAEVERSEKGSYAQVVSMYNHNQFYLFVYQRYTDVRLVGAPPSSIGNFGGDVDNWRWPRHTGDFAFFRIYTAPNGKPADYSKRNVPYKPKHFFPISLEGVSEGDFTMVLGYPGTTYRHSTSYHALNERDQVAPWVDKVWGSFIASIKDAMQNSEETRVNLTDKHDMLVNFWQKDTYQAQSMHRFDVVSRLEQRENQLIDWANQNSDTTNYSQALSTISSYYHFIESNSFEPLFRSLNSLISWPVEVGGVIYEMYDLIMELVSEKPSKRRVKREVKRLRKEIPNIFKAFNAELDQKLYSAALVSLVKHLPENLEEPMLKELANSEHPELLIPIVVDYFYQRSFFTSPEHLKKFLDNPVADSLYSDPLFMLHLNYEIYISNLYDVLDLQSNQLKMAMRDYTKGILAMNHDALLYPDANSTMRLSYGKVAGYIPRDGVRYKPHTYLKGKFEKEDPNVDVFKISPKEKELWQAGNFVPYSDSIGVPICFLTDNDITNGNSGSPVLNAQGHLVGIAFDGNFEAMACDFLFEPDMQRTIVTDIRYVLFIVDKYAGAQRLLKEMVIFGER
jgi:hypothetical protein